MSMSHSTAPAVPQNAYPTPPRFIGAVLRFLVIATLNRLACRLSSRLADRNAAASTTRTRPRRTDEAKR